MSELPKGWVEEHLSDLCEFNPKHPADADRTAHVSFVPMPAVDDKTGTLSAELERRPLSDVWKGYTHFAEGDVIFAKITPCMENGKIAVAEGLANAMACGSTEFHVLRGTGCIEPRYLWRYLRQSAFRRDAEKSMTGAVGQRRVPRAYLEETRLPLPPLAEQKRIVAKLDALSARSARARKELERIDALVARYKQAVLSKAFSGELTKDWRLHSQGSEWKQLRLAELITDGPSNGWSPKPANTPTNLKSLKLSATTSGELRIQEDTIKYLQPAEINARYWLRRNDILIQRANSLEYLGTSAVYTGPEMEFIYPDLMMRIRVDGTKASTQFLWRFLNSQQAKQYFQSHATGTAGNMPKINGSVVKGLEVPAPSLPEQREIVRRIESAFDKIDRLAEEAKRALALVGRLDEAVLAKAFRGELVPQDPNDEPASVLLERIRAERAAAPKPKRGRRTAAQAG
ncbi:restriction endonuclease subunit S [Stappia indica]|uniref:Type I restriction enzyme, S subunit n=1 Tax=Stappia indica TaxID=538381 RepID=A0A285RY69_9HYPH|nr:restriction endonuclease subunit S [Stappia indica]SOB99123.1 type I restriction enzyme, S subunit [Stappia indica]